MNLSDEDVLYICSLLSNNNKIEKIYFASNNLTNSSVIYLLDLLDKNKKINKINIHHNKINDQSKLLIDNKILDNVINIYFIFY